MLRRYVLMETAISAAINAVLSVIFALVVFGTGTVDLGARATWLDMAPQSFMVALMGTLVPTLLTRRRVAAGRLAATVGAGNVAIASLATAAVAAIIGVALYAVLVPAGVLAAWLFVLGKAIYGAALAAVVTPLALRRLLRG